MARGPQWLLALLAACGGGGERREAAPAGPVAAPDLVEDPAGRTVVAEVDGRPVYGDCVARQAAAHGLSPRAALDECIGFELLAAEAQRRGYATHPEVLDARSRELARAFIDREFAAGFDGPEDVPMAEVEAFYREYKDQLYVHPEWRSSHHILVNLGFNKVAPGTPRDQQARRAIDDIRTALEGRPVTPEAMNQVAAELGARYAADKLDIRAETVPGRLHESLDRAYREALFALPRVGALGQPVRSAFGWHVILLTEIEPAIDQSVDQAAADIRGKIFEAVRRRSFVRWASGFHGKPHIDEHLLAGLAAAEGAPAGGMRTP